MRCRGRDLPILFYKESLMNGDTTRDTLAAIKAAQTLPVDDPLFAELLAKSTFSQSSSPT